MGYSAHVSRKATPQSEKARADQVQNSAGGYTFQLDCWKRLDRFLILGNEGGTYYASEKKLTQENAGCIEQCLAQDPARTINRIVEISDSGRAPKNEPAIFALALAASSTGSPSSAITRQLALSQLQKVCRTGTHLFHFAQNARDLRGWSRGLRTAVTRWYVNRSAESLAMQAIKYQQRDGWSHKDLLRLSHASTRDVNKAAALRWVATRDLGERTVESKTQIRRYGALERESLPALITAFEQVQASQDFEEVVKLVAKHKLPHEAIPNQWKNRPELWSALLPGMGTTALIRNLAKMTSVGLLKPLSTDSKIVIERLGNVDLLRKDRIHPIQILIAQKVYAQGHGDKGSLTWQPDKRIVDALDDAFYLAFDAIDPTGKNILLACDISGSMGCGNVAGTSITPREAVGALAMVTARKEKNYHIIGFTAGTYGGSYRNGISDIPITAKSRLNDVCNTMARLPMGSTDCALPMLFAAHEKMDVDAFVVLTDNETWAGNTHPHQALRDYRNKMNKPRARLIVNGMTATDFTIADQQDPYQMDVVGFDAAAPAIMANFIRED